MSEKTISCATDIRRRYLRLAADLLIAFVVLVGSVILSALGGGLIGKAIAVLSPRYYPMVFPQAASQPSFDAAEMGIATGVGQGAAAGVVIGLAVILALAIASRRYRDS